MTLRLYEDDPFLFEVEAALVSRRALAPGREEIVLERTVFFATSGGQPHDTGEIEGVPVVEVSASGEDVIHVLAGALPESIRPGDRVRGRVDRARRLDHLRQHHGQHLLSAALARTAGLETVSVHFGAESSTLDLASVAADDALARAVDEANRVVLEDREVRVHRVARGDLARFALRREPGVEVDVLRIVEVDGFDATPCSGTHPRRTGQVGPIAVVGSERAKGRTRLSFVCGERALADARSKDAAVRELARVFSIGPAELVPAVERLRAREKDVSRRLRAAEEALAEHEARALVEACAGRIVSARFGADRSEESIAFLAGRIAALGRAAVLGGAPGGRAFVAVACPPGGGDAAAALRAALPSIEGKGGGSAVFARGAGARADGLPGAVDSAVAALARAG